MKHHALNTKLPTHEVVNQATKFTDVNLYSTDVALKEAIGRHGAPWLEERCEALGERAGSHEMQEWGRLANENPPVFKPFDRFGHRIDYVEFHPAYHHLMGEAMKAYQAIAGTAEPTTTPTTKPKIEPRSRDRHAHWFWASPCP